MQSTKSYASALKTAKGAAKKLGIKLNLRGLELHAKTGLTFSKRVCEREWNYWPCYAGRDIDQKGPSISIEYSSGFKGFSPDYYIVVALVDTPESALIKKTIKAAKKYKNDAYIKNTQMWMGCSH
jgi:hypothetical protein